LINLKKRKRKKKWREGGENFIKRSLERDGIEGETPV